jgi:hypothetical protein
MQEDDDIEQELTARRRTFIEEFAALPAAGSVVTWQRELFAEHVRAESQMAMSRHEMKWHRKCLRLIGDNLVWSLIPRHTIRSLGRHPGGPPPALAGQSSTFDAVWDTAELFLDGGFVPIVADLTNLIRIGDVVGWNATGIVVLECKNQPPPKGLVATSGRAARQLQRGESLETYLRQSSIEDAHTDLRTIALNVERELPEPDWSAVETLIDDCIESDEGVASLRFSDNDVLIASEPARCQAEAFIRQVEIDPECPTVELHFFSELMDTPTFVARPPSAYPIRPGLVSKLLEREVGMSRVTDVSEVNGSFTWSGRDARLISRADGTENFAVISGEHRAEILWPLIEYFLRSPIPVRELRDHLMSFGPTALDLVVGRDDPPLAPGDRVAYGTMYGTDAQNRVVVARFPSESTDAGE